MIWSQQQIASRATRRNGAAIIINADDWGRDGETTDRTLECIQRGAISSVSAMVFMAGSERSAALAQQEQIDCGLHLNLTTLFSASGVSSCLQDHQSRLAGFLRLHWLAPVVYHPLLTNSFEYVTKAQLEEYERLYGAPPGRIDGHHHMHLCANVVGQELLPEGVIVRRNFSFEPGEKSAINRWYRAQQDKRLARRYRMADFFFSLPPLEPPSRLEKIFSLAHRADVEVETHPVNPDEHRFLTGGELTRCAGSVNVAQGYRLRGDDLERT